MKSLSVTFLIIGFIMIGCGDNSGSENTSNEDYIEIISVQPGVVTEGEEVSITINFNYYLASENRCIIWYGFNNDLENPDKYMVSKVIAISRGSDVEPREKSETITITTRPMLYDQPDNYNLYLNLSPISETKWVPFAVDTWPIDVNRGASVINEERTGTCTDCDFVECHEYLCPN